MVNHFLILMPIDVNSIPKFLKNKLWLTT